MKIPENKIQHGDLFNNLKKVQRANDYWIFCHSFFWNTQNYTEDQQNQFRNSIIKYFEGSNDIDNSFIELVQRACLAKQYVQEKNYRSMALPGEWFDPNFIGGLAYSKCWFDKVLEHRNTSKYFLKDIEIFSNAILSYAENKNILDIAFYRQIFIDLKNHDLLQWYMNAVMHFQFINY
jgi:hypothetical protein